MVFTHPSPYPWRGSPATVPFVRLQDCRTMKRQNNHVGVYLNLSSLSNYVVALYLIVIGLYGLMHMHEVQRTVRPAAVVTPGP
jgi:hypothetical protein